MSRSKARTGRLCSCCRIRSAPRCGCGTRRSRRSPSTSGSCATTGAATADPAAPRVPIRWSVSAATCSPCSTTWVSRRPAGAASRWAAWLANGSAPTRPSGSNASCSPTPRAILRTRRGGTTVSSWYARKAFRHLPRPTWSAGSPRDSGSARPTEWRGCRKCSPPPRSKATSPSARRSATWTSAASCRGADAGRRRPARSGDPARGERVHQEQHPGCAVRHPRRRGHFQCRATRCVCEDGAGISAGLNNANRGRRLRRRTWTRATATRSVVFVTGSEAMDDKERYQSGADARRKILGDAWVDRADAGKTAFTAEWQDFITRCAWGEVWTRPHFEERTRRILVIGTMMAIGRWEEFRMHVRAALVEGGFSADDLKEIILQQAIYCGVPVGNHAFREAAAVLKDVGKA